jgi:hypothetical protein
MTSLQIAERTFHSNVLKSIESLRKKLELKVSAIEKWKEK